MRPGFTIATLAAALSWALPSFAENLAGSEWQPVWMGGADYTPQQETFIGFTQDGRFAGSGGCNRMMGAFVTNGSAILLGPAAMTKMACPSEISDQENAFVGALMSARMFERDGTNLTLSDGTGAVVLRMHQRDAD